MIPLFGYGTLRHAPWRAAIFGREYPVRDARLHGWQRVALRSGYLSIAPAQDAAVDGVLIALDPAGWAIADAWEEVPRYERVAVRVETASGAVEACAYVCVDTEPAPAPFVADDRAAALSDDEIERAIARFAAERDARRLRISEP